MQAADARERATPQDTLAVQRRAWAERPLVRDLYRSWFRRVERRLSRVEGPTVELGSGIGTFKEFMPDVVATDVVPTEWADDVVDAARLPYDDGSLANLVLIDVLHHLPSPAGALVEAARALRPGGRFVALEPYCSPASTLVWRAFHHERVDLTADPFAHGAQTRRDPFDANTALPTLIFWHYLSELERRLPELALVARERFACFVYPLSGGLTGPRLCPPRVGRLLMALDDRLDAMAGALGYRCLITLERRA
jgi:SAM-dependent methyltransferase